MVVICKGPQEFQSLRVNGTGGGSQELRRERDREKCPHAIVKNGTNNLAVLFIPAIWIKPEGAEFLEFADALAGRGVFVICDFGHGRVM
jgi:hypothetical protein